MKAATIVSLSCSMLLVLSCDPGSTPSSLTSPRGLARLTGPLAFTTFELGATPGTVCPGATGCTNGAAEPAIRADATGTFYAA